MATATVGASGNVALAAKVVALAAAASDTRGNAPACAAFAHAAMPTISIVTRRERRRKGWQLGAGVVTAAMRGGTVVRGPSVDAPRVHART